MPRFSSRHPGFRLALIACCLVIAGTLMAIPQRRGRLRGQPQNIDSGAFNPSETAPSMSHKQKQEFLKSKLGKMRKDAEEMTKLAGSIQEDLEKTTENELPLRVVAKAEQVEKLAKRIKNTAKGF